ncbi:MULTISPECIES: hypothetical protein [Herbaspirillum]|jgi:hypothetical protein|uniref:Uncharacterized protein n=1 Tax=Herbaspirillum frisingense TaxID=92645 RepID=A0ABU1PGR0_9BURK|nr:MULTISPECIES: hypothetical protein [Herbaspirillum]MDR6585126.1 hypothetical protein [Herbaspirillum frisingense]
MAASATTLALRDVNVFEAAPHCRFGNVADVLPDRHAGRRANAALQAFRMTENKEGPAVTA